jgi:glycosyltransferase 2 family protein
MANGMLGGKRGLYLSILVSLVSMTVILALTVDEDTLESVLHIRPGFIAAAFLMVSLLWLVEGLRIKAIAHALNYHDPLPLRSASRVYMVAFFFAGITPMAVGEWPAQVYGLCRSGMSPGESTAVALVRTFLTKMVFVSLAAFLLFVDGRAARGNSYMFGLFRYAFWIMTATTGVYLLLMWRSGLAQTVLKRLQRFRYFQAVYDKNPKVRKVAVKLLAEATHFQETIAQINRENTLLFIIPLFLTLLFWVVFYSIALVLLAGLGVSADISTVIAWQIMIMLVIPYIPVPGGSGVAEFGLATLFAPFVPSSLLGVFIVAWRFFTYYLTMILGGALAFGGGNDNDARSKC